MFFHLTSGEKRAAISIIPHNVVNPPEKYVVCVEEESLLIFIEEMDSRYDKVIKMVQSMMFLVCNGEAAELQTKINRTCDLMKDLKNALRLKLPVSSDEHIKNELSVFYLKNYEF